MAKSVNKVFLLGHVGKDPELRSTNGGTLVANLSLATTDRFKDSSGNWTDRAEWHNLVRFPAAQRFFGITSRRDRGFTSKAGLQRGRGMTRTPARKNIVRK